MKFSLIVVGLLCSLALANASGAGVVQLTAGDFAERTGDGKVHFIKFFAPWCGHCKKLAPTWAELAQSFSGDDRVSIASVDCTQHKEICSQAGVQGYPTLKVYFNGDAQDQYKGARALNELQTYIKGQAHKLLDETTA